jgi:ATP-binding cassette subfamily B multidrug efflux pump
MQGCCLRHKLWLTQRSNHRDAVVMFKWFEDRLKPTEIPPQAPPPRDGDRALLRFYWHYARQARFLIAALFVAGLVMALMDTLIPIFIGRVVTLVSHYDPKTLMAEQWPQLLLMALALIIGRPAALLIRSLITSQAIAAGLTNMTRWQSHWHVVRQSWTFFQNDFAGRVANRVMQTGPALRESIVSTINAVWYILVYGCTALALMFANDWRLTLPLLGWCIAYGFMLQYYVPRLRDRSRAMSEVRSALTGRVVDSYTNILTVKLFARARDEDNFVREAVDDHTVAFHDQLRMITRYVLTLAAINALMIAGTAAMAVGLWVHGIIAVGVVATVLPLSWQIANISGWVADNITSIFENVGIVQDGMKSIAVPRQMGDDEDAVELEVDKGAIRFEQLTFGYGTQRGVLHDLSLDIRAGERIGLVGHSGAGKSTLVNLLLRFHAPDSGRILIDGQDIAGVTQESLRTQIAMVTQDTSLLHRSIRQNIAYGRPWATEAEVLAAAQQAEALDFIETLEDWAGRTGFDAHVGERGVKLSGGQRQRIAIARVILKNAPILVLDEATSALDSEVEAAIQSQLDTLMRGRTVIAIAHRLSTIAKMDRVVVMDQGRIVEVGSHAALLSQGGAYARLWDRQSGGFVDA